MEHTYFHKLSKLLWRVLVAGVVLLAVYVSVGRFLMSNVGAYKAEILSQLNNRLPFLIEAEDISGEWHSFTPELVLRGMRLRFPEGAQAPVELVEGRLAIDTLQTLRTRALKGSHLALEGLSLQGEISDDGRFRIVGFGGGRGGFADWLEDFLGNVEQVALVDNNLEVSLPGGEQRTLGLNLLLNREGKRRTLSARLVSTTGTVITATADGVGNPFDSRTYSGDLYLKVALPSLTALRDMLPAAANSKILVDGAVELDAWIAWKSGEPSIEASLTARDLVVNLVEQDRTIPIESLAVQGTLLQQRNRWTLFASDLVLARNGQMLELPRLQVDSWGDSLRLRATDVQLAQVNALVTGLASVPQNLVDVLETLRPEGQLQRVQFSLDDYADLAEGWSLEANFEDVSVESWKGAPGVTSGEGYLNLQPGAGEVIIDSQQFSLAFPALYKDPLFYDEIYGKITLDWDSEHLKLGSGLLTASGVEGTANALFGLNIPFSKTPVGIEMELLVGLEDSHPIHRTKYLPYTLNEALLGWLRSSLGEGKVERGAFLWRGSLRKGLAPHRTIQLFFDVTDTELNYHPSWPQVSKLAGLVLIDDTNVSVWSERARLYDTDVDYLSAEAWLGESKQMQLAISGLMRGDASDGLEVINNSPLTGVVGGAFGDWQLTGELATRLDLQMNLGDVSQPPAVNVETDLNNAELLIRPGELSITGLTGELLYSTERGLSAERLTGELWGRPVVASVVQEGVEDLAPGVAYDPGTSPVLVRVDGEVESAALQDWQKLEQLALAQGSTEVSALVTVTPGETPLFTATSDLVGVSLDLPEPFSKDAGDSFPLQVHLPLAADQMVLWLNGDDVIQLMLDITGGGMRGGSLTFGREPLPVRPGGLVVGGSVGRVDEPQWETFVYTYFVGEPEGEDAPGFPIDVALENLRVNKLDLWGQTFRDILLNVSKQPESGNWRVAAQTDWFSGELDVDEAVTAGTLKVARLDLAGLDTLNTGEEKSGAAEPLQLPDLAVSIAALYSDNLLLGNLDFSLMTREDQLMASDISANIGGMVTNPEKPASYVWRQGASNESSFNAAFSFRDLGDVFARLEYQRILESRRGSLQIDLDWPGGPQDFALARSTGEVLIEAREGRFLEAPEGASGTLRVVSLLNFAGVIRRLSLSHMFESGIPFDSLEGESHLHAGTIEVDAIEVKGASSGFRFSGLVELPDESQPQTVNGELVVTLPVANNLPWVAALAAGLPVAAGVFVVSKVFEKQVNRFSSGVYKISGDLEEPEVVFDRIFDDSEAAGLITQPPEPAVSEAGAEDPNAGRLGGTGQDGAVEPAGAADPNTF